MRLGLVSTANINKMIINGAAPSPEVEVVAIGSRDGATAQAYASEHGIPRAHASYESLLEDPEVDAVYISLPNGMHHEWTMKSIKPASTFSSRSRTRAGPPTSRRRGTRPTGRG